ncbi:MAG: RsmE family RNA methyltransferase [Planctomycetia bacterium]|nr:RsmE family RNA methyltransferase [Planctomycetia bacterium]
MTRLRSAQPESSVERFFLRQPLQLANPQVLGSQPDSMELDGAEAHHLLHVLRAKVGDRLGLFNGEGAEALAEIVNIRKRSAELRLLEAWSIPAESRTLTIAAAMPKGDRARWLIEKSTELGVDRMIPLRTQRSVVEPGESKMDKLEQAVIAACKQCGRSHLMTMSPLTPFASLLKGLTPDRAQIDQPDASSFRPMIAHPDAPTLISEVFSKSGEQSALMLIGPEGGFTDDEFSAAVAAGATPVNLGPHILRIETAAIAVAASWRFTK